MNPEPKKSSAKNWILGGCGCLTVVGIVAAVLIYVAYDKSKGFIGDMMNMAKSAEEAIQAPEVIEAFGIPIEKVGEPVQTTSSSGGKSVIEITQALKGTKGEGKLIMTMEQTGGAVMPKLSSAKIVTPDGKEIPISLGSMPGGTPAEQPAPTESPESPAPPEPPAPVE